MTADFDAVVGIGGAVRDDFRCGRGTFVALDS
jgi:hypothetical protein